MRPIKFRVWDKQSEQMFNVYSIEFRKNGLYVNLDTPSKANGLRESWLFGDRFELMQFTGLHDKNGKEIYEGDIVSTSDNGIPGEDKWSNDDFGFNEVTISAENGVSFGDWSWNDEDSIFSLKYVEVIGSIYENPDLIK